MIGLDHKDQLIAVTVFGEFELADFKEFEALVNQKLAAGGPLDIYFDLREMAGATVDVIWEEVQFSRQHANDFRRIAIVTDDQWITWSAWFNKAFVNAELRTFDDSDVTEAQAWMMS